MSKKLTTEEFIERASKVHNNKYDYSKVNYVDAHTKVCIVCPIHGEFWQKPCVHLMKVGCKKCGMERVAEKSKKTREQFIEEARKIHGDKYDYSKVKYRNNKTKVRIICPIHGEFWQMPADHLQGCGCKKCKGLERLTTEEFINQSKEIHNNKYDYSKVKYINSHTKVVIVCPQHGEFLQQPYHHLQGRGCPKCQYEKLGKDFASNKFVVNSLKLHGNRYDYSKVEYKNNKTKVCIICKEHGEFWQTPNSHLQGQGCPHCQNSKLENKTAQLLERCKIEFINKQHFNWLGRQHLDFYLPKYDIAIECQGEQHFIGWMRKPKSLNYIRMLDKKKKQLCEEHDIKLYYINYNEDVETKLNEILAERCQSI